MLRFHTLLVAVLLVGTALGCKKKDTPPMAPGGGGVAPVNAHHTKGPADSGLPFDSSIGLDASPLTSECQSVDPGDYINGDTAPDGTLLTGSSFPADFVVTRSEATWDVSCVEPTILVELSDGKCPTGKAHKLQILFDANAIDGPSPTILTGLNTLSPEPDDKGIRVRYFRPSYVMPSGMWGSCAGMPGTLEIIGEPSTEARTRIQGRFAFDLVACDGSDAIDQIVRGTFNLPLRRGREDACPTK